jgi:hypothetical protein
MWSLARAPCSASSRSGNGVVLVQDCPPSGNLAQTNSEAKIKFSRLAVWSCLCAPHQSRSKRHVSSGDNVHALDVKGNRLGLRGVEQIPRLAVSRQPLRFERRRNVKHQNIRRMVSQNAVEIFCANSTCPAFDQTANLSFIGVLGCTHQPTLPHFTDKHMSGGVFCRTRIEQIGNLQDGWDSPTGRTPRGGNPRGGGKAARVAVLELERKNQ